MNAVLRRKRDRSLPFVIAVAVPLALATALAWGDGRDEEGGGFELDLGAPSLDLNLGAFQDDGEGPDLAETDQGASGDSTGTDPRDFTPKFMPYFLHMEMENDLEVNQLSAFGMYAFTPRLALTFDLPVVKEVDYSDVDAFQMASGGLPPGQGFAPSGGVPLSDLDSDGDNVGVGDLNLRLFARPESKPWEGGLYGDPEKSYSIMPVLETTLPTASDDVLGGEAWILSPGVTIVLDLPGGPPFGLGFIAMMNFFDFDAIKDDSRAYTSRFRGRWFWMQPLTKPGPNLLDGLYVLTEMQPIYDFRTSDFDFWIAPELGKIVKEGWIVYAKPGWGIDTEPEDRDFTLEIGTRIFF